MKLLRRLTPVAMALLLAGGPALVGAQEEPLAAGSNNVPVPKKKKHVQPVYPREALAQGIRGIVILDLVIDKEGRVAETHIIRSIPGLDEAALFAARQWIYEPVEVDGRPVSVRLTVPITFALKLPEVERAPGIPELRQGVTPPWPDEGRRRGGSAIADVTLDPDGRVGLVRIIEGDEPWSTALLQALRTWRFRAPAADVTVSFNVQAEFVPGGRDGGDVRLRLNSLREATLFDVPGEEEVDVGRLELEPEPSELDTPSTPRDRDEEPMAGAPPTGGGERGEGPPAPGKADVPALPEAPTALAESEASPAGQAEGEDTGAEEPQTKVAEAGPTGPAAGPPGAPSAPPEPGAPSPGPAAPPEAAPTAKEPASPPGLGGAAVPGGEVDPTAPPPVEILSVAPPPPPPENGISAIRGVLLEPGVPDLIRGRRPVSPPFARMAGVSGVVEVEFSVGSGGLTALQRADGPELLLPAARQAVESWVFRRTRADRAYLLAVFTYEDDLASALVRPQP